MIKSLFLVSAVLVAVVNAGVVDIILKENNLRASDVRLSDLPLPADVNADDRFDVNDFEDYLDFYLSTKYQEEHESNFGERAACAVSVNSLSEPHPVMVSGGKIKAPTGKTGVLDFSSGETVTANCAGSGNGLVSPAATSKPGEANIICQGSAAFSGPGWLSGNSNLPDIKCSSHVPHSEARAGSCGGGGTQIRVSFQAAGSNHELIMACFHENRAEALYVAYDQLASNSVHQSNVARPNFAQGAWYPGLSVDTLYTQNSQKAAIAQILNSQTLADQYVTTSNFLARGHLAAKTDFVLSPSQRATFTFINVAPQWQLFNGGNWNTLEQNLRSHIGDRGINTKVYTGTWGVLALKDAAGTAKNIYLSTSNSKIPVPLWFYKVVHQPSTNLATVYLGLNNPHVTLAEAKALAFCSDRCSGNSNFAWINWKPEDIRQGYSICCDVNDFRRTVNVLPGFTVSGLLY